MRKRLPFLPVVAVGLLLWRGGFGFLPTERTVTWRLPVPYAEVERLELQLWRDGALVQRQELPTPGGLSAEPQTKVPLTRGPHHAVATAWLRGVAGPSSFSRDFDPGASETLVLEWARAR